MRHGPTLPSLKTELLLGLGFLTSSGVLIAGLATFIVADAAYQAGEGAAVNPFLPLLGLWLGSTLVFVLFGTHLLRRVVLRPLDQLSAQADRLAAGAPDEVPPRLETVEMAHLSERFGAMASQLLDAQSHLVRAEKLAGIGRLAAGVAHEIRNPLGALANYVEVLRGRAVGPADGRTVQPTADLAAAMAREIERIDRIVESLLDYSRPKPAAGPVDLNEAVARGIGYLRDQGIFPNGKLQVALEPGLPGVRADRSALEQVVVNLLLNARDAAPGGRVWVGTVARTLLPRHLEEARAGDAPAGNGVAAAARRDRPGRRPWRADLAPGTQGIVLYVADEGAGVPDDARERVFDPFFTTKPPGQGTGLGLAIVQSAVDGAGGLVWVDRAREGGAVFKVFLPAA
ncbi:MAG TPA: ATP-binding protein [Gemmatimonadales bacterium]|nr:ATP-binding protein [Gemmatimonadales bacterium]